MGGMRMDWIGGKHLGPADGYGDGDGGPLQQEAAAAACSAATRLSGQSQVGSSQARSGQVRSDSQVPGPS